MFKHHFQKILLAVIVIGGLFLRLVDLDANPPSLNWDEVSHGYNAYSILKTGRDEWGIRFPMIFRAYGDYKLPAYIYLTTVPIALLGLNSYSVRLVSVLSGVGLILLAYLIGKKMVGSNKESVGLFSAFLTAITPWGLFLSRVAVEANLATFFFTAGLYAFMLWESKPKKGFLVGVLAAWWLSIYSYNSARIVVPFFLVLLFVLLIKKRLFGQVRLFLVVSIILVIPLGLQIKTNTASARYHLVSLIDQGVVNQIETNRQASHLPQPLVRFVYNRPSAFVFLAAGNYLKNLNPMYLFFRGGSHYQFSFPDHELLYLVSAPFIVLGLIALFKDKSRSFSFLLLSLWLVTSLIPSAVTKDAPHVLRTILVLPAPMILAAIGLFWLKNRIGQGGSRYRGNLIILAVYVAITTSFCRWWFDYQTIYPRAYSWSWQYGYTNAVDYIRNNYLQYDQIYFTKRYGEPHEFLLFYLGYDPAKYQKETDKVWDYHASWYWVDHFDKYTFVNDWEIQEVVAGRLASFPDEKILLVTSPANAPDGLTLLENINFLDSQPAFQIYSND